MADKLFITVYGLPAPQGSKRHVGKGIMIESSAKVQPWREAVKMAALVAMGGSPDGVSGPISVQMIFTMNRPKTAPRTRKHPDRKPDLSKLIRSTEDALTDIGAWEDDARVVSCLALKVFPGCHDHALATSGAVIIIEQARLL